MKSSLSIALALLFLFISFSNGQAPESKVVINGLTDQVTVRRDGRSIPYIEAKNDGDLYFMQGYVTASDRLWQMDMMRRLARGETAELTGNLTLEEDKRWRRFGFARIAEQSLINLSPNLRKALDDYAKGVNAYIATLTDATLPPEFKKLQYKPKPWQPTDTIVIGKILADALSSTWRNDLLRASLLAIPKEKFDDLNNQITPYDVVLFGADKKSSASTVVQKNPTSSGFARRCAEKLCLSVDLPTADQDAELRAASLSRVGLYAEDLAASNNWVISGKRTADGKPLLANDPHLAATAPGIWYLTEIQSPNVHAAGVTLPGVPGIVLGHNDFVAWGATNVGPDVQDLYTETFNEKGEYKTSEGWQMPVIRKEVISVRANPMKTDTNEVNLDVIETRNGIVITDEAGKKYALKWTARDPKNNEFEAFFGLNRAKNWEQFRAALKTYGGSTQNFVYADVKGNIGWYAAGRIPLRRTGDGALPYDGATNAGDWTGYIPFDELPHLYNPPSGLIVTANQRIVGTSYKYTQISRDVAAPWRANRIKTILDARQKITMDDVRDVQFDVVNLPLVNLSEYIVVHNSASPETIDLLKAWDGTMMPDSRAALLVNEIRGCMANRISADDPRIPAWLVRERVLDRAMREDLKRWLPKGSNSFGELASECDKASRISMADPKRFGPDETKWVWGSVWKSRFQHPLAGVPFIGGQFATPNVPIRGSGQTPNVGSNVSMRLIASPGNWDLTRHVIPLGESGDPRSPHFKDQFEAWKDGTQMIFPFTKAAINAATLNTMVITPK